MMRVQTFLENIDAAGWEAEIRGNGQSDGKLSVHICVKEKKENGKFMQADCTIEHMDATMMNLYLKVLNSNTFDIPQQI